MVHFSSSVLIAGSISRTDSRTKTSAAAAISRSAFGLYYDPSSSRYLHHHHHHRLVVSVPPTPLPLPPLLLDNGISIKRGIIIPPNRQTTTQSDFPPSTSSASSSSSDDNNANNPAETEIGPRGVRPISVNVEDMDDTTLVLLGSLEDHNAREEILKRHIMDVDHCTYQEACQIFDSISQTNLHGYYKLALPYYVGIYSAVFVGFVTIPLVFHLPTIEWFNEWAVTTDIPEARDLETPLEVSIWSWNWMEPPLGTMSFLLLCSQYVRAQMANLGIKPYTRYIKNRRGEKLANAYPKYNSKILIAYSETAKIH